MTSPTGPASARGGMPPPSSASSPSLSSMGSPSEHSPRHGYSRVMSSQESGGQEAGFGLSANRSSPFLPSPSPSPRGTPMAKVKSPQAQQQQQQQPAQPQLQHLEDG